MARVLTIQSLWLVLGDVFKGLNRLDLVLHGKVLNKRWYELQHTCRSPAYILGYSTETLCCQMVEWLQSHRMDNSPGLGFQQPVPLPVV
jgi:hypothetical protein